jgi:glutamine synthetase
MSLNILAEYIWIDGSTPTRHVRSKTKVIRVNSYQEWTMGFSLPSADKFPEWAFDGSSTGQAEGAASDCILQPVRVVVDPTRHNHGLDVEEGGVSASLPVAFLVLCEVMNADGTPHPSNTRARLRETLDGGADDLDIWIAFEQEYTLYKGSRPLGFPEDSRFPAAQGPYYCGVGSDEVYGRQMVEDHLAACLDADLFVTGINAEVMPGQWEFQVGGPGGDALLVSDHLWFSRWLLYRIGEEHNIYATLDQKPVTGDWNGAGMHTNFSTTATRGEGGITAINEICATMSGRVEDHLEVYGDGIKFRLTGAHETCAWDEFKWGIGDRTASIRIPLLVAKAGCGYLEDRRPGANADPYEVSRVMAEAALLSQGA